MSAGRRSPSPRRRAVVKDKMQRGYVYYLSVPVENNFHSRKS